MVIFAFDICIISYPHTCFNSLQASMYETSLCC